MTMSRKDFTELAEWVGREDAEGGFDGALIASLASELKASGHSTFKPEKFTVHATREAEIFNERKARRIKRATAAQPVVFMPSR